MDSQRLILVGGARHGRLTLLLALAFVTMALAFPALASACVDWSGAQFGQDSGVVGTRLEYTVTPGDVQNLSVTFICASCSSVVSGPDAERAGRGSLRWGSRPCAR